MNLNFRMLEIPGTNLTGYEKRISGSRRDEPLADEPFEERMEPDFVAALFVPREFVRVSGCHLIEKNYYQNKEFLVFDFIQPIAQELDDRYFIHSLSNLPSLDSTTKWWNDYAYVRCDRKRRDQLLMRMGLYPALFNFSPFAIYDAATNIDISDHIVVSERPYNTNLTEVWVRDYEDETLLRLAL